MVRMVRTAWMVRVLIARRRALTTVFSLLTLAAGLTACSPTQSTVLGPTPTPTPTVTSTPTPTPTPAPGAEPAWGFPFRPGLTANIGLPEKMHPDSRLHDSNYDYITDDQSGTVTHFGHGDGWDYASLDVGVYGGSISSDDVSDENALALARGRVLAVQKSCNAVLVDYFNGWWVIYLHLDANRIWVKKGDNVVAGMPIGVPTVHIAAGCPQSTSFQHVHFAFLYNGAFVSMRNRLLCGHKVLDDGIDGVAISPSLPSPVPLDQNFIFTIPSTCPAEQPLTNVVATTSSAGYRVLRGQVIGLRAQWTMPRISGPSDSAMNVAIDVGCWQGSVNNNGQDCIGVFTIGTVQSDGTTQYSANVDQNNNPTPLDIPISPGDHLAAFAQLADGSTTSWVLSLTNATQGKSVQSAFNVGSTDIYPTFDIGPINGHAFANFSDVQYSNAQVRFSNGSWVDMSALPYQRTEMHDGDVNGTLVARATTQSNSAFIVSRMNPTA